MWLFKFDTIIENWLIDSENFVKYKKIDENFEKKNQKKTSMNKIWGYQSI